jgi:hypothetical protein
MVTPEVVVVMSLAVTLGDLGDRRFSIPDRSCPGLGRGHGHLDGRMDVGDRGVADDAAQDVADLPDIAGREQPHIGPSQVFGEGGGVPRIIGS